MSSLTEHKIVVVGGGGVGKSALTIMLMQDTFLEEYDPTIEDSYRKEAVIDNETHCLDILDTAGQEEYEALRDAYMRDGEGFLLVYSITEKNSLAELKKFYQQIIRVKDRDDVPLVVAGNKCDLESDRQVTKSEGEEQAKQWGADFFETSAKDKINVQDSYFQLVRNIIADKRNLEEKRRNQKSKGKPKKKGGCNLL